MEYKIIFARLSNPTFMIHATLYAMTFEDVLSRFRAKYGHNVKIYSITWVDSTIQKAKKEKEDKRKAKERELNIVVASRGLKKQPY